MNVSIHLKESLYTKITIYIAFHIRLIQTYPYMYAYIVYNSHISCIRIQEDDKIKETDISLMLWEEFCSHASGSLVLLTGSL